MALINTIFAGTFPRFFKVKRFLLKLIGFNVGENSKIVAPLHCNAEIIVGKDCWIGENLKIFGNGNVIIENNIDIAPDVKIITGSHEIGDSQRRAGKGKHLNVKISSGAWIGANVTIVGSCVIGKGSVVGAGTVIVEDVPANCLVVGNPARVVRKFVQDK